MANHTKFKLKKGDTVKVLTGKDRGRTGAIKKILTGDRQVLVEGINTVVRNKKPTQFDAGGQIRKEMPLEISNVAYFDAESGKISKIGYKVVDGVKKRYLKALDKVIG